MGNEYTNKYLSRIKKATCDDDIIATIDKIYEDGFEDGFEDCQMETVKNRKQ